MNRAWIVVGASLFVGALGQTSLVAQQTPRERIDVSKLGPQVGKEVPDFTLRDQNGRTRNLKSIMGPKGAMLVFVRSADW
jgi:cytochrome oxidase Cu insertion factor (SCO1/SenC/PrrC family)